MKLEEESALLGYHLNFHDVQAGFCFIFATHGRKLSKANYKLRNIFSGR